MTPNFADVHYGPHERQVMDVYLAKSDKPTPLLLHIHGGGWLNGDNKGVKPRNYLAAGISVIAIEYRFVTQAGDLHPPVKAPLGDAARALQFIRSKAKEWNLDKQRVCATGSSAGACSSLWLAFHDDMADAASSDPVARESTRLWCAAVVHPQTSLDPKQMREWIPNIRYGGHAFGFNYDKEKNNSPFDDFYAARESILPWIKEYSPYGLVSKDDPPIYMTYEVGPPAMGKDQPNTAHSANFGQALLEHCRDVGVECELVYPGAPDVKHPKMDQYIMEKLKAPKAKD